MRKVLLLVASLALLVVTFGSAAGASVTVVRPSATAGWSPADMRGSGAVEFVPDATTPYGDGAFEMRTTASNLDKAQWLVPVNLPLSAITTLGYSTRYLAGPAYAGASFQLVVDLDGGDPNTNWTIFVFEPYWNSGSMTVDTSGAWQTWNVAASGAKHWSSRTRNAGGACTTTAGAGGPPFYNVPQLQANCPNAVVLAVGVNVGTYNPGYTVRVDGVWVNGTVYDFEPEVTVRVTLTENVVGFEAPGAGWAVTLTGCGVGPLTATTDSAGEAVFVALPPANGCSYTVTVAGQDGWTLTPDGVTVSPSVPGDIAVASFLAIRDYNPPCVEPDDPRCQPAQLPAQSQPTAPVTLPTSTPTPAAPSPTPTPVATAEPSPTPSAVAGDTEPGSTAPVALSPTPKPPATGAGVATERAGLSTWFLLAGVAMLTSGLGLLAIRRRS